MSRGWAFTIVGRSRLRMREDWCRDSDALLSSGGGGDVRQLQVTRQRVSILLAQEGYRPESRPRVVRVMT